MHCVHERTEVMGRDVSILASHPAALTDTIRAIIDAESRTATDCTTVNFALRPTKVHLFHKDTEERICF